MDDTQPILQAPSTVPAPAEKQSAEQPVSLPDPFEVETEEPAGEAKTETEEAKEDDSADEADEANDADDDTDEAQAEKPKRRSGVQRLKAQVQRLQAELETARNSAPVRSGDNLQAAVEAEIGPPPAERDFADYLEYERALRKYDQRAVVAEERIKDRVGQFTAREQARIRELVEDYEDGQIKARKVIPDYDTVLQAAKNVPVAPHIEGLILESDKSALIAYHLAKNPEKVDRLNAMAPVSAAREIGRLEARLSLPSQNKATSAPKPISAVKGGASPTPKVTEMSMEEYAAMRSKGWRG